MNIKLSDIIWTVICFGLFTLVLNCLLIRPVLKIMDGRKARVEKARAKADALREAGEKAREDRRLALEAEREKLDEAEKERLAAAHAAADKVLSELSVSLREQAEERQKAILERAELTEKELGESMGKLVDAFSNKLISGGES